MKLSDPAGISSLVITLSSESAAESQALAALAAVPGLDLGAYRRPWLAAVLESANPADACRCLQTIPGVVLVEVTFVEVSPAESFISPKT